MTYDPMEKVEQNIWERFKGFAKRVAENDGTGVERRKMARIAPILTHFSVKRQEAVLNGMRWHSWVMLSLTVVILLFMIVQIVLTIMQLSKG